MASKLLTEKQKENTNDCEHCETDKFLFMYRIYVGDSFTVRYQVGCSACGTRGPAMGQTSTAIDKWNYIMG
jgi:hypothetical protein